MKVLWVGDTPNISTGFSRCTRAVCDELHARGHEVNILGINEHGDPSSYHSHIWPCVQRLDNSFDVMGNDRLPRMIERLTPDLVILLQDPWNVDDYFLSIDRYNQARVNQGYDPLTIPPIIAWLAVDAKNQPSKHLNKLHHLIVWTEFAKDELRLGGYEGECDVVPCGVDTELFYPMDKVECRLKLKDLGLWPESTIDPYSSYVVGVVGRNQSRKRLDLTLQYFAEWIHTYGISDAHLYLYVAPTGEKGCNIASLVRYYGLGDNVCQAYGKIGVGADDSVMPLVYNSFDLYTSTTQGEGFGLPCLEAMACSIPCEVPDWSGYGSWIPDNCTIKIPCTSTALSAPMNAKPHTIGGIADKSIFIHMLDKVYRDRAERERLGKSGLQLAQGLTWKESGRKFVDVVEGLMVDRSSVEVETVEEVISA